MLCIGIYRVKDPTGTEPTASSRRYVITNPPGDFILMMSDLVSVIDHRQLLLVVLVVVVVVLINKLVQLQLLTDCFVATLVILPKPQIFVLLQFDPGLEYHNRQNKGHTKSFSPTKRSERLMVSLRTKMARLFETTTTTLMANH